MIVTVKLPFPKKGLFQGRSHFHQLFKNAFRIQGLSLLPETGIEVSPVPGHRLFYTVKGHAVNNRFHTDITGQIPEDIRQILLPVFFIFPGNPQGLCSHLFPDLHLFPQMSKETMEHHMEISPVHLPASLTVKASQISGIIIDTRAVSPQFSILFPHHICKG